MSHACQIEEARMALVELISVLFHLVRALSKESEMRDDGAELNAAGESAAMAAEVMADKLCAIESLALPADMREEAPSLDEVLAYLDSIGQLHEEKAAKIAAEIIEYLQCNEYGQLPSGDNYPALEEHETMTGAIDALLSSLEREA